MEPSFNTLATMPTYIIYRDPSSVSADGAIAPLAFFPAKDSDELFDALRAKFPHVKSHADRMRDATIEFLMDEQVAASVPDSTSPMMRPMYETSEASPWQSSWPSESTTTLSSPESMALLTPTFYDVSTSQQSQQTHNGSTGSASSVSSPRPLETMTSVFSLSTTEQPRQRIRRKMTDAEKLEYRRRRIVKACEKCKARKRKCDHNEPEADKLTKKMTKSHSTSKKTTNRVYSETPVQSCKTLDFTSLVHDLDSKGALDDVGDFTLMYDDPIPDFNFDDFLDLEQLHAPFTQPHLGLQSESYWDGIGSLNEPSLSHTSSYSSVATSPLSGSSLATNHATGRTDLPDLQDWYQANNTLFGPASTMLEVPSCGRKEENATIGMGEELAESAESQFACAAGSQRQYTSSRHSTRNGSQSSSHACALASAENNSAIGADNSSHDLRENATSRALPGVLPERNSTVTGARPSVDGISHARSHAPAADRGQMVSRTSLPHTTPYLPGNVRNATAAHAASLAKTVALVLGSTPGNPHDIVPVSGRSHQETASRPVKGSLATTSALSARTSVFDSELNRQSHIGQLAARATRESGSSHSSDLPRNSLGSLVRSSTTPRPLLQSKDTAQDSDLATHVKTTNFVRLRANGGAYPRLDGQVKSANTATSAKLDLSAFAATTENGRVTELAAMRHIITGTDTMRYRDHHGRDMEVQDGHGQASNVLQTYHAFGALLFVSCIALLAFAGPSMAVDPTLLLLACVLPVGGAKVKTSRAMFDKRATCLYDSILSIVPWKEAMRLGCPSVVDW